MLQNPAAYTNVAKIKPYMDRLSGRNAGRVADILIGDSTTIFGGYGHDSASMQAFHYYGVPAYATGLNGAGENWGTGSGIGHFSSMFAQAYYAVQQMQIVFSDVTAPRNGERFRLVYSPGGVAVTSADCVFSNVAATMRANLRNAIASITGFSVNSIFVTGNWSGGTESNTTFQVYFVGPLLGKPITQNEKQSLVFSDLTSGRNGETFKLTIGGNSSADIAFNSTAATMRTNLDAGIESITGIGASNVTVTGSGTTIDPFVVEFNGTLSRTEVAQMTRSAPGAGTVYAGTITIATTAQGTGPLTRTTPVTGTNYAGTVTITHVIQGFGDFSAVPSLWWTYLEAARQVTKWRLGIKGTPTSGSFTVRIDSCQFNTNMVFNEVATIPFNATGAQVQALFEALPSFNVGDVAVTGPAGGPWDIDFLPTGKWGWSYISEPVITAGTLNGGAVVAFEERSANTGTMNGAFRVSGDQRSLVAGTNGHLVVGNASNVIGVEPGYTSGALDFHLWYIKGPGALGGSCPTNVRGQWNGNNEVHRLQIHNAIGGTFTLSFGGNTTTALQWDDSAANVQAALLALPSIGAGNATVTKVAVVNSTWNVTFTGSRAAQNVAGNFTANLASITRLNTDIAATFETGVFEGRGTSVFFPTVGGADHVLTNDDVGAVLPYVARDTFSLAADAARDYDLIAMYEKISSSITPPFGWLWQCSDRPDILYGAVSHTLVARGGRSLRTMVQVLRNSPVDMLTEYFNAMRYLFTKVGQSPCFRVRVFSGVNDRNDAMPSTGGTLAASNTYQGFYENLSSLREFFEAFWTARGWPVSELHYDINVSPIIVSGDADLAPFRQAAVDFSDTFPRACACDVSKLVLNFSEAQARFGAGADASHPSIQGFYDYHRVALWSLFAADVATSVVLSGGNTTLSLGTSGSQTVLTRPEKVSIATVTQDGVNAIEINIPELHGPSWVQLPLTTTALRFSCINGISRVNVRSLTGDPAIAQVAVS